MAKLHATVLPSLSERALSRERSLERGSLEREPRGDKEGDAVGYLEPLCCNLLPLFFLLHHNKLTVRSIHYLESVAINDPGSRLEIPCHGSIPDHGSTTGHGST